MNADALVDHLASGATHVCHCWAVRRRDGFTLGFTDHDRALAFDSIDFLPENGLSARAIASTTGLAVNNSEAIGVLQSDAITEADIDAGRYDAAEVTIWLVCWDDVSARRVKFFGTIGEITRANGGFQAELRGLTDMLNQPQGRSYMRGCNAVLGEARCGVDLGKPWFSTEAPLSDLEKGCLRFDDIGTYAATWFEGGTVTVLSGEGSGLRGVIKRDEVKGSTREITLWEPLRTDLAVGDRVRIVAGCDKRSETCKAKFDNFLNFQGFPDIPGDDWLVSVPKSDGTNNGRSRRR